MNAGHRHVREREEELQIFSPNLLQASVCALGEKGKEEEAKRNRPPSSSLLLLPGRSVGRRPQCFSWVIKTASRAGEEREKGKESEKLGGKKWGGAGRAKKKRGRSFVFSPRGRKNVDSFLSPRTNGNLCKSFFSLCRIHSGSGNEGEERKLRIRFFSERTRRKSSTGDFSPPFLLLLLPPGFEVHFSSPSSSTLAVGAGSLSSPSASYSPSSSSSPFTSSTTQRSPCEPPSLPTFLLPPPSPLSPLFRRRLLLHLLSQKGATTLLQPQATLLFPQ